MTAAVGPPRVRGPEARWGSVAQPTHLAPDLGEDPNDREPNALTPTGVGREAVATLALVLPCRSGLRVGQVRAVRYRRGVINGV